MRSFSTVLSACLTLVFELATCVDPEDLTLRGTVDVIVVDGTITNLNEPQLIRINRSKADPLTGRFGNTPVTKATVEVVVDSVEVVACHETEYGTYQMPTGYRGQVGHAYQLRFTLEDGTSYASSQQVMLAVPPIDRVTTHFNETSLLPGACTPTISGRATTCLSTSRTLLTSLITIAGTGGFTRNRRGAGVATRQTISIRSRRVRFRTAYTRLTNNPLKTAPKQHLFPMATITPITPAAVPVGTFCRIIP